MTLPQIAPDRGGLWRRKKPRGNLSKVIVRITVNAGIFLTPKTKRRKTTFMITIVPPAGKFNKKEIITPLITDKTEKIKEAIIVIRKLMESCSAVSGCLLYT